MGQCQGRKTRRDNKCYILSTKNTKSTKILYGTIRSTVLFHTFLIGRLKKTIAYFPYLFFVLFVAFVYKRKRDR